MRVTIRPTIKYRQNERSDGALHHDSDENDRTVGVNLTGMGFWGTEEEIRQALQEHIQMIETMMRDLPKLQRIGQEFKGDDDAGNDTAGFTTAGE